MIAKKEGDRLGYFPSRDTIIELFNLVVRKRHQGQPCNISTTNNNVQSRSIYSESKAEVSVLSIVDLLMKWFYCLDLVL